MDHEHALLQSQLDQYRALFRDHRGHLAMLSLSGDPLLRALAEYALIDLTLERHVVMLGDEQLESLLGYSSGEERQIQRELQAMDIPLGTDPDACDE
ncbi:MAG: hypothetical protein ACYS8X_12350 [Planctomycetota bacterium]|jgi:hypothetical protein